MKLNLISLFFLTITFAINLEASLTKLESNFEDVYYKYEECNDKYITFVESLPNLKNFYLKETNKLDFQIGELSNNDLIFIQQTLKDYCDLQNSFDTLISNLEKIFQSNSKNKDFLLTHHLYNMVGILALHETDIASPIYNSLTKTLALIKNNIDTLDIDRNWSYSITSLYNSISYGSLVEFSDSIKEDYSNQNFQNFLLYSSLEDLILETVKPTLQTDTLKSIAMMLMRTRIKQISENRYFGSSVDSYLLREEFGDLYLEKYKDKTIKYTEFNNIFLNKFSDFNSDNSYIEIELDSEALDTLITFSVDKTTTVETSEKEIKFTQNLLLIMAEKFEDNPAEILSNLPFTFTMIASRSIDTCSFSDKDIKSGKDLSYFSLSSKLNFIKFACNEETKYFKSLIADIKNALDLINDNSLDLSLDTNTDTSDFIEDSLALLASLFQYTGQVESKYTLNKTDLDLILGLSNNLISKFKKSYVKNSDSFLYLGLFESYLFMLTEYSDGDNTYDMKVNELEDIIFQKFPIDAVSMKKQFSELISNYDSDNANEMFMSARYVQWYLKFFITDYFNAETWFWPDKIVDDVVSFDSNDEIYLNIINNLELLTYVIDNLDNIFKGPDYFLFIFKDQSIDKWYLFRELVPVETYMNYILFLSNKITWEDYLSYSEKRQNQLLQIRPNNIAMQKFRDDLLESDYHKPIKNLLNDYDDAYKSYAVVRDSQFIMASSKQEFIKKDISDLKWEYKYKLMDIEDALFSDEHSDILPSLFSFESHDIKSIQDKLGEHEAIISTVMQPDAVFGYTTFITKNFTATIPQFEPISSYSDVLIQKFSDPNSTNYMRNASNLYYNLLGPFEEFFGSDNEYTDIYIVPDSSIQNLPFHALYDYKNDQWAIEKYKFKYLSSEKLYLYLDKHKLSRNNSFFGIGNPSLNKNTIKSQIESYFSKRTEININNIKELPELPETEEEIVNIGKFFNNKKLYFQNDAYEKLLYEDQFINSDVVAFATHSVRGVNDSYNDRGLVLTPRNLDDVNDDGFLGSIDVSLLNFKNEPLVMLSACNTIDSPYFKSLPFSGLPKSFMNAGANSILMSLWNIDSYSAKIFNESLFDKSIFTRTFYLGDSLQGSMIDMINSEQYSHPYYWAPYIYLGK